MADHMSTQIHRAAAKAATVQRRTSTKAKAGAATPAAGHGAVAQLRDALSARAEVVQMKEMASVLQRRMETGAALQRVEAAQRVEEEEPMQAKSDPVQRVEEEEPMQAKTDPAKSAGLPAGLQAGVESLSGMDMSDVRVHRNSSQPASLNALAYAQGSDIHLAPGQEQHLPHEAWHVVQQRQGRVQPTMQMQGVPVNDEGGLEAEADSMGQRAMSVQRQERV